MSSSLGRFNGRLFLWLNYGFRSRLLRRTFCSNTTPSSEGSPRRFGFLEPMNGHKSRQGVGRSRLLKRWDHVLPCQPEQGGNSGTARPGVALEQVPTLGRVFLTIRIEASQEW